MSNTYENVIPAATDTVVYVQRASAEDSTCHTVVAWASVNGGPLEALVDLNDTGELVPLSLLRKKSEDVYVDHPTDR